jgi:hypothetical protein
VRQLRSACSPQPARGCAPVVPDENKMLVVSPALPTCAAKEATHVGCCTAARKPSQDRSSGRSCACSRPPGSAGSTMARGTPASATRLYSGSALPPRRMTSCRAAAWHCEVLCLAGYVCNTAAWMQQCLPPFRHVPG